MSSGNGCRCGPITFRADPMVKAAGEGLRESMGPELSAALNMFLRRSLTGNGMPFRATSENSVNAEACRQADSWEGHVVCIRWSLMKDAMGADSERVA